LKGRQGEKVSLHGRPVQGEFTQNEIVREPGMGRKESENEKRVGTLEEERMIRSGPPSQVS